MSPAANDFTDLFVKGDVIKIHEAINTIPDSQRDNYAVIAAENGHLSVIQYLVEYGVYGVTMSSSFIIRKSIEKGHLHLVKYFCEELHVPILGKYYEDRHMNDNKQFKSIPNGWTLLQFAVSQNQLAIVQYLVDEYAANNKVIIRNILEVMIGDLSLPMVEYLCGKIPESMYKNLMSKAVGNLSVVKFLIEKCGLTVKCGDIESAAMRCKSDVIQYFLEECTCVDKIDYFELCLISVRKNDKLSIKYFVEKREKIIEMFEAAFIYSDLDLMRQLLDNYLVDMNIYHALELFARKDNVKSTLYLIEKFECVITQEYIEQLINYGNLNIIRHLKFDPEEDFNIYTAHAAKRGQLHIVKYFIEEYSCVFKDNEFTFVIVLAIAGGDLKIIRYLLEKYKPPQCEKTLIFHTILEGRVDILKYFIELFNVINLDSKLMGDALPVHSLPTLKYLIEECKCDPKTEGNQTKYPKNVCIFSALRNGYVDSLEYLMTFYTDDELRQIVENRIDRIHENARPTLKKYTDLVVVKKIKEVAENGCSVIPWYMQDYVAIPEMYEDRGICSICVDDTVTAVKCGGHYHHFCKPCIEIWIEKGNAICPMCKTPLRFIFAPK